MGFNWIKKMLILVASAGLISLSFAPTVKAQVDLPLLGSILAVLTDIDNKLADIDNKVGSILTAFTSYTSAWTNPDTTDTSTTLQGSFNQMGTLMNALNTPSTQLPTLNSNMLGNQGNNVFSANSGSKPTLTAITATSLPYANDLLYSTLLGQPIIGKDTRAGVDSSLNFIQNASGANIYHVMPGGGWNGSVASQQRYQAVYNTIVAATSYNNYVLSNLYTDKTQFSSLQQTLIQESTDQANWFAKVSSENIGVVLRQILMYQSQVFVLLTQMVQLQKQMVSVVAMNTAVSIAGNQMNESTMASSAQGKRPSM